MPLILFQNHMQDTTLHLTIMFLGLFLAVMISQVLLVFDNINGFEEYCSYIFRMCPSSADGKFLMFSS